MDFDQLKLLTGNGWVAVEGQDVFMRTNEGRTADEDLNLKKTFRGHLSIAQVLGRQTLAFTKTDKQLDGGTGIWIPYVQQANVWGFLKAGHTWIASGPFSGCVFEVGECDGRIYAAHLSRESVRDSNIAAWSRVRELARKRVLFRKAISVFVPQGNVAGTAAIVVAKINTLARTVSVTRLDAVTANAGSMKGRVLGVSRVASDPV